MRSSVYFEGIRSLDVFSCNVVYAFCEIEAFFFISDGDDFSFEVFTVQEFFLKMLNVFL